MYWYTIICIAKVANVFLGFLMRFKLCIHTIYNMCSPAIRGAQNMPAIVGHSKKNTSARLTFANSARTLHIGRLADANVNALLKKATRGM